MASDRALAQREIARRRQTNQWSFIEPALAIGSSAIAEPVSGLLGLTALPFGSDVSAAVIDKVGSSMRYQPRTPEGRRGLQAAAEVLQPVGQALETGSRYLGDKTLEYTGSPALAAAAYSAPTAAMEAIGLKGAGRLTRDMDQFEVGDISSLTKGPQGRQQGIFAGVKAKGANLDQQKAAEELLKRGVDRDTAWRDTGWYRDSVDGQWKWEIDDSRAILASGPETTSNPDAYIDWVDESKGRYSGVPLANALKHDDLYSNYPQSQSIRLKANLSGSKKGYYDPGNREIGVIDPYEGGAGYDEAQSTVLHELQHSIQEREGFAKGGGPEVFYEDYLADVNIAKGEVAAINAKLSDMSKAMDRLKQINTPAARDALERLSDSYSDLLSKRVDIGRVAFADPIDIREKAFRDYRRLAGEAEARNVQARRGMTPEQRRQTPPWQTLDIPEGEQIGRGFSGKSLSEVRPKGDSIPSESKKLEIIRTPEGRIMMKANTASMEGKGWLDVTDQPIGQNAIRKYENLQLFGSEDAAKAAAAKKVEQLRESVSYPDADDSYKMQHTAPMLDDNPSLVDVNDVFPDIYGPQGLNYYGTGATYDTKAISFIKSMRGNPNKTVTVYRAVPDNVDTINAGDWVTSTREYARDHIGTDKGYKIITKKVKASELATDGNSIHEFGYDPSGSN